MTSPPSDSRYFTSAVVMLWAPPRESASPRRGTSRRRQPDTRGQRAVERPHAVRGDSGEECSGPFAAEHGGARPPAERSASRPNRPRAMGCREMQTDRAPRVRASASLSRPCRPSGRTHHHPPSAAMVASSEDSIPRALHRRTGVRASAAAQSTRDRNERAGACARTAMRSRRGERLNRCRA